MSKSKGSFSSAMKLEDCFPEYANGGSPSGDTAEVDGASRGRGGGRKGQKHRNSRSKSNPKQNGQNSKEQTPTSPPPEDRKEANEVEVMPSIEVTSAGTDGSASFDNETQNHNASIVGSPGNKNITQTQWDATATDDDFVTANNSAEADSINGNLESHADVTIASSPSSKESEEDAQNSNTSLSTGTLTPTNSSVIFEDEKTFNHPDPSKGQGQDQGVGQVHLPGDVDNPIVLDGSQDEEGLTDASLAVHFSDTACDPSAFQSFITETQSHDASLCGSPLSVSRSAPTDLSTILEQDRERQVSPQNSTASILYPNPQNQFQTSTPIPSSVVPSRRNRSSGSGSGTNEMNFTTGEAPSTICVADATSALEQEEREPTYIGRANRAFMDLEAEASAGVTKESGICDMSTTAKDSKSTTSEIEEPNHSSSAIEFGNPNIGNETEADVGTSNIGNESEASVAIEPHLANEEAVVVSSLVKLNTEVPKITVSREPEREPVANESSNLEVPVENDSVSDVDEEVEEINKPFLLPSTVTELTAANGVKVYVVGTAHFSRESQLDVIQTLEKVQPGIVVLELCRSRSGMLRMNEEEILREAADMSLSKIQQTIRQTGPVQGLLHVLLLQMTASLTKKLGMAPGGEFRVAVQEAHKIPDCNIHFGDRNLAITLNRALSGLGFFQKIRLAWHFLKANDTDITKEEVEACKEKDLLEKLLVEMAGEFPSITRVLLDERDLYLANSLWLAATGVHLDRRGNPVRNTRPVVGVVGMGHVAGITRNWGPIDREKMDEIVRIPETPLSHVIIGKTIRFSCYTLLGFVLYKSSRKLFSFPSDELISSVLGKVSLTFQKVKPKVTGKW